MEILQPNGQRAKTAIILIWVVLAMEIINLISSYFQYDLLLTLANGGDISDEMTNANDTREAICGVLGFITYLISGITFIMWFYRAYSNLHKANLNLFKQDFLSASENWTIWCWFVPIVCFYRPYQLMKELYVETKNLFSKKGVYDKINYTTTHLGYWWALYIISEIIGKFIFKYALKYADTLDELIALTFAQMISSVLIIPLAIITVKVIKEYSAVEPILKEFVETETAAEKAIEND